MDDVMASSQPIELVSSSTSSLTRVAEDDNICTGEVDKEFENFLMEHLNLEEEECDDDAAWTREDDKQFETLLIEHPPEEDPSRFGIIAFLLSGKKSVAQVQRRYSKLVADVEAIEVGLVPPMIYREDMDSVDVQNQWQELPNTMDKKTPKRKRDPNSRWTVPEHKLFIKGVAELGKGDWRGISRRYVKTKSPKQVASHAQKYDLRQNRDPTCETRKRRKSIHDITTWETQQTDASETPASQHASHAGPIDTMHNH